VFGTQSLLRIAHERGRIDDASLRRAVHALIGEYVVDIPYDHAAFLQVAAEQDWEPRSVAFALSRGATWSNARGAFELFSTAFRNAPESTRVTWAYAALTGLRDSIAPEEQAERLSAFTVLTLGAQWARPDHAAAFVTGLTSLMPDEVDQIVQEALKRLWRVLHKTYQTDRAVTVFMYIVSGLDERYRQYATQLILQEPPER
jgi:hypothetical protein